MNKKIVLIFLVVGALFASGLAVRRAVLTAQYERYGRPLPFNLESALGFRYVRLLFTTGVLPVIDKSVQYPDGVIVRQTYEIGAEYVCAVLARLFRENVPLAERVRWISVAWFCLGIPAIFFWIWWWQRSLWGAALAGAFYALSLASVIRSTGQEFAHENFALPLLIAHLAFAALAERKTLRFSAFICLSAVSAVFLAGAIMLWDLIQFYIIVWALLGFIRVVKGDYFRASVHRWQWALVLAALIPAGLLNPYLSAHGFAWSPAMLLAYGTLLAMYLPCWQSTSKTDHQAGNISVSGKFPSEADPPSADKTLNIQRSTSNFKRKNPGSMLKVQCWMLEVASQLPNLMHRNFNVAQQVGRGVPARLGGAFGEAWAEPSEKAAHPEVYPPSAAPQATRGSPYQSKADKVASSSGPNLKQWGMLTLRLALALLPVIIWFCLGRKYMQTYHHFAELLYAKIIFFNAKPADPSLLTFDQRILWVPALHSATFFLTKTLFPFSLPLFLVSAGIFLFGPGRATGPGVQNPGPGSGRPKSKIQNSLFDPHWRIDPGITGLFFFSFISLMAFILFVRMHVFAAIGFAASIGFFGVWATRQKNALLRGLVVFLLLTGAVAEGVNILRDPARWGGEQPYLNQRRELVDWLKTNAPRQPVLANFGISAFVLAYADCPIILHPKFESPDIRKRVQEYGEMLFRADEEKFRLWADRYGAAFYIHSRGEFSDVHPEAQMRYFVDALNPPPAAPARLFEFNPLALRWFVLLWGNAKYRVFRIITPADEQTAVKKAAKAQILIAKGLLNRAETEAEHALLYDPGNKNAQEAILRIDGLKRR